MSNKSFFETKKFKTTMNFVYGMGAAVVIVGALFKILHLKGADLMLSVGLLSEAGIFVISSFEPVHMDPDWSLVYPELAGGDPTETKKKQVAIAIHATCQAKYWNNPTGWQEVVDWCSGHNYEVVLISNEDSGFMGNIQPTGIRKLPSGPIENAISEISKSEAFIGIGSGLSWLAWALGTPTILISGFSHAYTEPLKNTARICSPAGKCAGCFNTHKLDPSDWN